MDQVKNSQGTWATIKEAVKQSYRLLRSHPILMLFALLVGSSVAFQNIVAKHDFFKQGFTPLMSAALLGTGCYLFLHYLFVGLVYKLAHDRLAGVPTSISGRLKDLLSHKIFVLVLFTLISLVSLLFYNIPMGTFLGSVVGIVITLGMPIVILSDSVSISGFFSQVWSLFKVSIVPFIILFLLGIVFVLVLTAGLMLMVLLPTLLIGLVFPSLMKLAPGFKSYIAASKESIMKFVENPMQTNSIITLIGLIYVLGLLLLCIPCLFGSLVSIVVYSTISSIYRAKSIAYRTNILYSEVK